jgi:hypothetical protein
MVFRAALVGLAVVLLVVLAVGAATAALGAAGGWVTYLVLLGPLLGGVVAALMHPGPAVTGWPSFVLTTMSAPVIAVIVTQLAAAAAPGEGPDAAGRLVAVLLFLLAGAVGAALGLVSADRRNRV